MSYRAQLAGWQGLYLPEVGTSAELPPQLAALKRQQFRWAKGMTQCLIKLGWTVWQAALPWPVKLQAFIHLGKYLLYPIMLILAVITPIFIITSSLAGLELPLMALPLASLGTPFLVSS